MQEDSFGNFDVILLTTALSNGPLLASDSLIEDKSSNSNFLLLLKVLSVSTLYTYM